MEKLISFINGRNFFRFLLRGEIPVRISVRRKCLIFVPLFLKYGGNDHSGFFQKMMRIPSPFIGAAEERLCGIPACPVAIP